MSTAFQRVRLILALGLGLIWATTAAAADRAEVRKFLEVTGFDVALDSIAIGAENAPAILGQDPGEFGLIWKKMVQDVMDPEKIRATASDILEQTLAPDLLTHTLDFYGSDLGQRLVAAENASHLEKGGATKDEAGEALVAALMQAGPEGQARLDSFRRMSAAIDADGQSLRAMQEVQIRFLLAAAAAGVIQLKMDEPDLRELFRQQEPELRRTLAASALASAAYTYQAFSDDEVRNYADALEKPQMRQVYELMNAVQYEIMASRFEMLAARLAGLQPAQDL